MANGIFIISELTGKAAERVREIQQRYDRNLAANAPPHVTLTGSSGVGPMPLGTPIEEIREAIAPIAESTAPITLRFGRPLRFMQTEIVVLPLDPHGPLRHLHERLARSGLRFEPARFTFSPHCTLSLHATLFPETERALLSLRVTEPVVLSALQVYALREVGRGRKVMEVGLGG